MRKADKSLDNKICKTLTRVCETALENVFGFQWLTHRVNYQRFPDSLRITCVFSDDSDLSRIQLNHEATSLRNLISESLEDIGIRLDDPLQQIRFDSEQACDAEHQGDWERRLRH